MTDPRAVANLLLDEADGRSIRVTNLSLQKLLYFAHLRSLRARGCGVVSGYFEAWQLGPVHPTVYRSFKAAGSAPITFRAQRRDPLSGSSAPLAPVTDEGIKSVIAQTVDRLGSLSARTLVEMSHAPGGPWDHIVNKAQASVALGLRIPDHVILELSRFHAASVNKDEANGGPTEDAPLAGN